MDKKIGIIDMGSNSVRLVIYEITENGAFKLIDDLSDTVRLSENMLEGKYLNEVAMRKAIKIINLFKKLCIAYDIAQENMIAFATAAVRKAENSDEFLCLLEKSTGLCFRVLSGDEEALFVYRAVIQSIEIDNGIIVDIGGGSTEIIYIKNKSILEYVSVPIGAVVATEDFLDKSSVSQEKIEALEKHIYNLLSQYPWLKSLQNQVVVGLGGTIRNLAKIHKRQTNYPLEQTHNHNIDIKDFSEIYEQIKKVDLDTRKNIRGLSAKRADIIVGGLAILNALVKTINAPRLIISGDGVREGIMYDYIYNNFPSKNFTGVLPSSIDNYIELYNVRRDHAEHVCHLALSLFDQLKDIHHMGEEERKLLHAASLLHDIGISIDFYAHYNHTFYIILSSRLNGLTHRELLLVAAIAASHAKDKLKEDWQKQYHPLLLPDDISKYQKLSMLLRISESLDRSETGTVKALECQIHKKLVKINTFTDGDAELEIRQANENVEAFKKIFKKQLLFT